MKRIMLLAVITGALVVPATAAASGGIGAGGVPACAAALDSGHAGFASIHSVAAYPGPPGPMAGPNSTIDWSTVQPGSKNNGTALVGLCQSL
jgi:hypothetical protein